MQYAKIGGVAFEQAPELTDQPLLQFANTGRVQVDQQAEFVQRGRVVDLDFLQRLSVVGRFGAAFLQHQLSRPAGVNSLHLIQREAATANFAVSRIAALFAAFGDRAGKHDEILLESDVEEEKCRLERHVVVFDVVERSSRELWFGAEMFAEVGALEFTQHRQHMFSQRGPQAVALQCRQRAPQTVQKLPPGSFRARTNDNSFPPIFQLLNPPYSDRRLTSVPGANQVANAPTKSSAGDGLAY